MTQKILTNFKFVGQLFYFIAYRINFISTTGGGEYKQMAYYVDFLYLSDEVKHMLINSH